MKKRILFVDDEPNVLNALRRMLRPMRTEWDMEFAPGGREALDVLATGHFDVVVSDMRMPGIDGEGLLGEIMRRYPHVVRIILSGQSSKESTVKSIGVAHQFLAKPCDAEKLMQTIEHAFALRDLLTDKSLKETLSQMGSIPSMPALYAELVEELQHLDASAQRVGQIVAQDPGMTVKVLQLVNSAFFGLPRRVSNPEQATALLGVDTMKVLVLSIDVFSRFSETSVSGFSPEAVQKHSSEIAALAKRIAVSFKAPREVADAAMMAGFLHDVGKLILAQNLPEQYQQITTLSREGNVPICQAERDVLGATHAEVGAYVLGLWGLSDAIVEATAFHHNPSRSFGKSFSVLTAVHVANALVVESGGGVIGAAESLDMAYLARVGVADRVSAWRNERNQPAQTAGGVA
jgi:putative nucleotidyltransferase with HDIG domain